VLNVPVRLLRVVPVLATSLVVLTGCGVAGAQFHPGVAAQVGDETITTRHVDQVTADACTGLEKFYKAQGRGGTSTPMGTLAGQVTAAMVQQLVAEQLAHDYDIRTTAAYKDNLNQAEQQLSTLSDAQKDAVLEVVGAQAYADDVLVQIGEIELKKQGTEDSTADDQKAAGEKVLAAWVADHDVQLNPKYGITLGSDEQADTGLSYAVSKTDQAGLPSNLLCFD
jgi:peptidyl-prolyl cis-trans isomerase SurA